MVYKIIKFYIPNEKSEDFATFLIGNGFDSYAVEDYRDLEEIINKGTDYFDYIDDELLNQNKDLIEYSLYLPTGEETDRNIAYLKEQFEKSGFSDCKTEYSETKDEDFENNWKEFFHAFNVGKRLLVKPVWEEAGETDRTVLNIDPGSAFGTGSHATTRLCLEALDKIVSGGERVLDMGCGSGILGLASLLLGSGELICVDIDENAADCAKENLEKNGFNNCEVYSGNVLEDNSLYEKIGGDYDIICANIVADIIILMKEMFFEKLKKGGRLIASGILDERADEVKKELLSQGFKIVCEISDEGWTMIEFCK